MRRRHTQLLEADAAGIRAAAVILRDGGLVAMPTETVYGLGAHALDARAVRGIFEAKGRPTDDPVIVHLAESALVDSIALPTPAALRLGECFWPGPLSLVLPKRAEVPAEVTAGLETVAVRVPSHPVAHAILLESGLPVAAPSANLFGRPSPTTARHVLDDLDGRIDAVVDGGPTQVGVESTIIDLSTVPPRLLRPGGVPSEVIEAVLGVPLDGSSRIHTGPQLAPGMLAVHYAPRTPLVLIVGPPHAARGRLLAEIDDALANGKRVGVLALEEDATHLSHQARVEVVGSWDEPRRSAARLFQALRALDDANLDVLLARELADPTRGLGRALADRLRRASRHVLDSHD
jgi:L-threonylcarbamoyladenylate synthase